MNKILHFVAECVATVDDEHFYWHIVSVGENESDQERKYHITCASTVAKAVAFGSYGVACGVNYTEKYFNCPDDYFEKWTDEYRMSRAVELVLRVLQHNRDCMNFLGCTNC